MLAVLTYFFLLDAPHLEFVILTQFLTTLYTHVTSAQCHYGSYFKRSYNIKDLESLNLESVENFNLTKYFFFVKPVRL